MELSLYRVYSSKSKFLFSEEVSNMDMFTMGFEDEKALKEYLSAMPRVLNPDGSIDEGCFVLIDKKAVSENKDQCQYPIIYGKDFLYVIKQLHEKLLHDTDLLRLLINRCPEIFEQNIINKLSSELDNETVYPVYKLNVDSFGNSLYSSRDFKKNFRSIVGMITEYDRDFGTMSGKKPLALNANGNK